MSYFRRRDILAGTAIVLLGEVSVRAGIISGHLPWSPNSASPPPRLISGPWIFFTASEGAAIEALADRIIPPDPETLGGKDAGCTVFLDRQLGGAYGRNDGLYNEGPFQPGTEQQGPQSSATPAAVYRTALAALDKYSRDSHQGKIWVELATEQQVEILQGLEGGAVSLEGVDGKKFFETLIKDIQEGFFADPIYGGNRDMCAWKMIGFPGAHYDYRDWVSRHNERYPHPPVSIAGRPDWNPSRR